MVTQTQLHDWLALVEISGPFLAVPVLKEAFPQGLEELDAAKRKRLRQAYDEWRDALETDDLHFGDLHAAWIEEVLSRGLELDEDGRGDVLKRKDWCAAHLTVALPEHCVSLSPDFAVVGNGDQPLMHIHAYGSDVDLDATAKLDGWASTPAERMVTLCRASGCRLGLVTNGERWMLVDAPVSAVTTFASWYARIWGQEPATLQAFAHLLGIRRFFVDEAERLPALFDRSLKFQDEVTDALGEQVRRALEVLIQSLDKADQDRDRELLRGVKEAELYEAALTVMMRLVFLLSAEERGLLLLGDECYEANYAISTLRMQLRAESDEILERRGDAWSRLLAVFRAVYGGIKHENLRLPALGGSLFDPDRFPFLEGRAPGSNWRTDVAKPLPIDNRTVLLLLEAIQQFQGRTLSYRALDVEQIGYVYEGLLERTVKRTAEVTLELDATKSAQSPWVMLVELESAQLNGAARLAELLQQRSGSSASRVRNDLARPVDDALADRVLTACNGDTALRDRIKPFAHLVRTDPWGYPLIYPAGAFIVTTGSDRRETGTHYTPKSLTEPIVAETLTPIAYVGPAQGTPRADWILKSPAELLNLKVCDPAMGSGAFLVQACRWLADRLEEAWAQAEAQGHTVGIDGRVVDADANVEALPHDTETRIIVARRLIAERCLYGVDLNPLAVELAKLSIWLVTLAKGRPFGFLDHNLRQGDSLFGIHRLDQLTQLSMNPTGQGQLRLFGQNIEQAVREAVELRQRLREMPIRDIRDVEAMAHLDADVRRRLAVPESIANAFIGVVFAADGGDVETRIAALAADADRVVNGEEKATETLVRRAAKDLAKDSPSGDARRPFHWPLEFPEVFTDNRIGFDALVLNPPFMGGTKISGRNGSQYLRYLKGRFETRQNTDLCAYFVQRVLVICSKAGTFGFLATKTIAQADTREASLDLVVQEGSIYFAHTSIPWPGVASVVVSVLAASRSNNAIRRVLDGRAVNSIDSFLSSEAIFADGKPHALLTPVSSFKGVTVVGTAGFCVSPEQERAYIAADARNSDVIKPFLGGADIMQNIGAIPNRLIIDFADMPIQDAMRFGASFEHVATHVRPLREKVNRKAHRERWWQYGDVRQGMRKAIANLDRVLVSGQTVKYLAFVWCPITWVFDQKCVVVSTREDAHFAILNSSVFEVWTRALCATLGETLSFAPSDAYDTFPWPEEIAGLTGLGKHLDDARRGASTSCSRSLTDTYNAFHDQRRTDSALCALRSAHRSIDLEIAKAYGWADVDLEHGFHSVPYLPEHDRVRFTISERARLEVLRRLSELNRQRYEEERAVVPAAKSRASKGRAQAVPVSQAALALVNASTPITYKTKAAAPAKKATPRSAK